MNILTLLITAPLAVFAVLFAVSNMEDVTAHLMPFEGEMTLPLYALGLGMLALGFFCGALFVWILSRRTSFHHWKEKRRAGKLEQELHALKKRHEEGKL
jgi:hypothetical protein